MAVCTTGSQVLSVKDFRPRSEDVPEGWKNRAHCILRDILGDHLYNTAEETQFQDVSSETSIIGHLGDTIRRTKLDLFHSYTLPMELPDDTDRGPIPVGGSGFINIVSNPKFPDHAFFRKGRMMRMRLRHNNLSFEDDAMLDGRVACLKFADMDSGGPLDLIFHTGRVPQYYNADSFQDFVGSFRKGPKALRQWCIKKPANYFGRVENVRKTPTSYYKLRYYSHVTYNFLSRDGVLWFARFRLIPADGSIEDGLLSKRDQSNIWDVSRPPKDSRSWTYLRDEYLDRLDLALVQYRLQVQLLAQSEELDASFNSQDGDRNANISSDVHDSDLSNPFNTWDTEQAPWLDLAIVTVTTRLSQEVLARTRFNIGNHVMSCCPLEPKSSRDFSSLALATREFHGITGRLSRDKSMESTSYKIVVVTGKLMHAGTDADVFITITGTKGRTPPISLDQRFRDDFEAGQADAFEERGPRVGDLVVIEMMLSSVLRNKRWFLEEVVVDADLDAPTQPVRFPCYQWLSSQQPSIVLFRNQCVPALLTLHPVSYLQRKFEVAERRTRYQWQHVDGLPGRVKVKRYEDLPREAQFDSESELDLFGKYLRTLANTGTGKVSTLLNMWDIFEDNPKLITKFLKDKSVARVVMDRWQSDEEFGRQVLNGPHPIVIERLYTFPEDFRPVTKEIHSLLDRDVSIQQAIEEGHFYKLEYPELSCLERSRDYKGKYTRYLTCPTCLLYVDQRGKLLPLAITLEPGGTAWTARDHPIEWGFAKMWVREADAQVHQVVSRHLHTQLLLESVAIATVRNLPAAHPVFRLLLPHFRHAIAVNVLGRSFLYPADEGLFQRFLAVGGQHEELLREAFKNFHINMLNLPFNLRVRGVDDPKLLPNYHYRDDALRLWNIINKYLRTVLYLHYFDDDKVRADNELQAWIQDLVHNGLGGSLDAMDGESCPSHGLPSSLHGLDELVELLTILVFTASVQHAALSSGMLDYYAFVPNAPTVLLAPPPANKGKVSVAYTKKALPSSGKTAEIIAACYTLSRHGPHEVFLDNFTENYFTDEPSAAAAEAYKVELARLSEAIVMRNQTLNIPYTYLIPGKIPKSVGL